MTGKKNKMWNTHHVDEPFWLKIEVNIQKYLEYTSIK